MQRARRFLLGAPIPTSMAHHERLSPFLGLPVFSSDSLSSVAYATEAILGVLILGGAGYLGHQIWISIAIVLLIVIIAFSYQQTIHAYPSGGGSYIVASENLGETAGLFAGAALLIDYVLTVSVSIAAGVLAITALYPFLLNYLVLLSLGAICIVAFANLRGVRESGAIFAFPTYGFVVSIIIMIAFGAVRAATSHGPAQVLDPTPWTGKESNHAFLFLVLRSFAAGCTALTGIEAVSNGVQAFKAPEALNAAGGVPEKLFTYTFWLTADARSILKAFNVDVLGLDPTLSLGECLTQVAGEKVNVSIKHRISKKNGRAFPQIDSFAKAA